MTVMPLCSVGTTVSPEVVITWKVSPCLTYFGYVWVRSKLWSASTHPTTRADAVQRSLVDTVSVGVSLGAVAPAGDAATPTTPTTLANSKDTVTQTVTSA